jgi:hypothetical protein
MLTSTPPLIKTRSDQRILVYQSYHAGESHRAVEITEEEYNKIKPYAFPLGYGDSIKNEEVEKLIWETLANKAIDIRENDYEDADIIVANC